MTERRRLNLNVGINSTGYSAHSWRYRTGTRCDFVDYDYYVRLTRIAHRGRLDAVFLSDHPALSFDTEGRSAHALDPLILMTALAASVPDIGIMPTLSSSYNAPYNLARRAATLDLISGGRLIFNVVSSFNPAIAANFGEPLQSREVRYRKANEFLDVVKRLWLSWDPFGAGDPDSGHLWNRAGAVPINHKGEFFTVAGPLNVPRGPQGHPVIAQAGASEGGIDLAARHGEIIYCSLLSLPAAHAFGDKIRSQASRYGRDPDAIRIVPALVPIIAGTKAEALRRHEQLSGGETEAGLIDRFARNAGLDLAKFDPDAPLDPALFAPRDDQRGPIGFTQALRELLTYETLTARQAVRRVEGGHRLVIGTAEQVADAIIAWWESGAVDGFTIQPPSLPDDLERFVDEVVPILQARNVFPREYEGSTIRERYGLPFPTSASASTGRG